MQKLLLDFKHGVIRHLSHFNKHLSHLLSLILSQLEESKFKSKSRRKSLREFGRKTLRESRAFSLNGEMPCLNLSSLKL